MSDPAWRGRLAPSMGPLSPHRAPAPGTVPAAGALGQRARQTPAPTLGSGPRREERGPQPHCTPTSPCCPTPSDGGEGGNAAPPTHTAAGGAVCRLPQPHSVTPQPLICQTRGRSKHLGAGRMGGEAPHVAPAAEEGAGEGDKVKLGGRSWTRASPSLGFPSHRDAASRGQSRPRAGGVSGLGLQTTHST